MARAVRVEVRPLGARCELPAGGPLADALAAHGAEFPCGGRGRCRGCRVRVAEGELAESDADLAMLSGAERAEGWRLGCQARPVTDLVVELRQWAGLILADDTPFPFTPAPGYGVAVDVGTTTIVAQLVELETGRVRATRSALNPQARWGADLMSRLSAAAAPGGAALGTALREGVAALVAGLLEDAPGAEVARAALVGNTAMHHLFLGLDTAPLAAYPFEPREPGAGWRSGAELGWPAAARGARACFLPALGGFVGSDILAVILATRLHEAAAPAGAADLGTNGEIVLAAGGEILVASTAAGPAFEGARISCGMRAAPGAIDRVARNAHGFSLHVVGGGPPRGVCGSGLVDAVAAGLEAGLVEPSGRLPGGRLPLREPVALTQHDIRELQLAKGAIAAGLDILLDERRLDRGAVDRFFLAGAFGHNLSVASALRIGLFPFPAERIAPVGNAALLGAKVALGVPECGAALIAGILPRVRHVPLERRPDFHERFAEAMSFPAPVPAGAP